MPTSSSKRTLVMKNILIPSILLTTLLLMTSCQQTDDISILSDSFTLKRHDAEMPVYVHGNATDNIFVLTLHGGPGDSAQAFRTGGWNEELEEKYAMVYWDQRGAGSSQGNLNSENFNLESMKNDVLAVVALLKHKYGDDITLFLYGHSWGAVLGANLLIENDHQDLFNGWISSGSSPGFCTLIADLPIAYRRIAEEQIEADHDKEYWEEILELADDTDVNSCRDYRLNGKAASATLMLQNHDVINANFSNSVGFRSNVIVAGIFPTTITKGISNDFLFEDDEFADLEFGDQLDKISLPSLVLHGKYDMHAGLESGIQYFDALGSLDKRFVQFDRSAHTMFKSEKEIFASELIGFIESYK